MFVAHVTLSGDVDAVLKIVIDALTGDGKKDFLTVLGRRGSNELRAWFTKADAKHPNKKGFPRSHFWLDVANSVSNNPAITDNRVTINIAHPVIAFKVIGGTIKPRVANWLTIPVVAAAYGKTVREYEQGESAGVKIVFIKKDSTTAFLMEMPVHNTGEKGVKKLTLIYVLKKSVTVAPMADALPDTATWQSAFVDEAQKFLERELAEAVATMQNL
jgi:hypothetical protein